MKKIDKKIRTEHTIMDEFIDFLNQIAKNIHINRIIPWRITRKQSGSSDMYISFAYPTHSWLKYNLKKWSTSQEVFVVSQTEFNDEVVEYISKISKDYTSS